MRSDIREFTYNDLLQHDKNRVDYIHVLHRRAVDYYLYLNFLAKKDKPIHPQEILEQFSKIDFKYPALLKEIVKEN